MIRHGSLLDNTMASPSDNISMALFCDFENVALGVRDAKYEKFDIKPVLERLLLKGSIVVKKAYCDWERYKGFKATMHEANFELIEIPHVRQSGKNSADIRLVVDALDLCYTKSHVNTFVIISGDSDFSPLVSKLRENAKQVIGVGVKQSTSDLLIANCDEFIFYDDLVRESQRALTRRQTHDAPPAARRSPEEEQRRKEAMESRRSQAIEIAAETFDALLSERGDSGKIWASVLKEAIKRRKPDFSETYYGFRTFGNLLEEAQARGLLQFGRDEKSGAYVFRGNSHGAAAPVRAEAAVDKPTTGYFRQAPSAPTPEPASEGNAPRQRGRGGRAPAPVPTGSEASPPTHDTPEVLGLAEQAGGDLPRSPAVPAQAEAPTERPSYFRQEPPAAAAEPASESPAPRRRTRGGRKPASTPTEASASPVSHEAQEVPAAPPAAKATPPAETQETAPATPRKTTARPRRARKSAENPDPS